MRGKSLFTQIGFLFLTVCLHAAESVDFYATVSSSADSGMIKMTTDLFFNQLQSLDGYTVTDKRGSTYDPSTAARTSIAFFAEIQEDSDGSWICTLNAVKASDGKNVSETKKYASYYKILLDAKSSLENLFRNLSGEAPVQDSPAQASVPRNYTPPQQAQESPDSALDDLAGTWRGEQFIEKILILRGGRGFVVFKNGATMNISVTITGKNVRIVQTGGSNASFFPEIPRQLALQNAPGAKPIEWNLTLTDKATLKGVKSTLVENSGSGVTDGTLEVTWSKI